MRSQGHLHTVTYTRRYSKAYGLSRNFLFFSVHHFILFLRLSINYSLIKIEKGRCYEDYGIKTVVTF